MLKRDGKYRITPDLRWRQAHRARSCGSSRVTERTPTRTNAPPSTAARKNDVHRRDIVTDGVRLRCQWAGDTVLTQSLVRLRGQRRLPGDVNIAAGTCPSRMAVRPNMIKQLGPHTRIHLRVYDITAQNRHR